MKYVHCVKGRSYILPNIDFPTYSCNCILHIYIYLLDLGFDNLDELMFDCHSVRSPDHGNKHVLGNFQNDQFRLQTVVFFTATWVCLS